MKSPAGIPICPKGRAGKKKGEDMTYDYEEEKELTASELIVMKAIWDAGEDIAKMKLQERLKDQYGRDYAMTTISTFLVNLINKGYVKNYRVGKMSYIHVLKSEEEYKENQIQRQKQFWYAGKASDLICAVFKATKKSELTKEDTARIRSMLDEMDDNTDNCD